MSVALLLPLGDGQNPWVLVKDGDDSVRSVFDRHYSRKHRDGRTPRLFVGPGQKMVLRTEDARAIFGWRKFISDAGEHGVNCAFFRNESDNLSSDLILYAMDMGRKRWPGERVYTYVRADAVQSTNPGYCFIRAGWNPCGYTKGGLRILESEL